MPATFEKVLKDLQEKKFAPLYFLQGDEPFYIDQVSDFIEQNALTPAEKGFNQTIVYGKDVNISQVLDASRRFPMMAQRQVVIVKEAQSITDIGKKEGQEKLLSYAANIVPTTILVFAYKHKKLDGKTKLYKELDKNGILLDSKKLYDNQLPDWIVQYGNGKGIKIIPKAAYLLAEYIGNDLSRIGNEIDKILLNYDTKVDIDEQMVTKHVGISKEYNVFELQKALAQRNVLKSHQILQYFEANPKSNPGIMVVANLFTFFSRLLIVHQHKNLAARDLATKVGVNPFFMNEYLAASRNYPLAKNAQVISYLNEADLRLKGVENNASESQVLKEMILKILA